MEIFVEEISELRINAFLKVFPYEIDLEHLTNIPFTTIGLIKNTPKYGDRGIKLHASYTDGVNEVVRKTFAYDLESENASVTIKFDWYTIEGNIGVSKTEYKPLNIVDVENIKKGNRKRTITYLQGSAKGTPIEIHVNELLSHYFNEVLLYEEGGTTDFENAINNETDPLYLSYLNIVIDEQGKTVKNSILNQIQQ